MSDFDWRQFATCRGIDPDLFFPRPKRGAHGRDYEPEAIFEPAKAVCSECPARQACLEQALAENHQDGVWGGTSPRERARIRKQRRLAARPA